MKTIVAATDLSERSDIAIRRAVSLARASGARLHVVHVVDGDWPLALGEAQRDRAKVHIGAQIDALRVSGPIDVEVSAVFGDPGIDVPLMAADLGAQLIVAGRHRERGAAELSSGSTIERMSRTTTLPLLVATRPSESRYARAVVGIDFSKCAANALSAAATLVGQQNVIPVHAYRLRTVNPSLRTGQRRGLAALDREETERFVRRGIAAWIADQGLNLDVGDVTLREGSPPDVLPVIAAETGADLVCVGVHGRFWLATLILGSTAKALLRHADRDVLIAPL